MNPIMLSESATLRVIWKKDMTTLIQQITVIAYLLVYRKSILMLRN